MGSSEPSRTPTGAKPARREHPEAKSLLFVTVSLGSEGGGIAAASRLMLRSAARFVESRQIPIDVLHLGSAADVPAGVRSRTRSFDGNRMGLALAVTGAAIRRPRQAQFHTFVGTARPLCLAPKMPPVAIYVHGIDVWRRLSLSRRAPLQRAREVVSNSSYTQRRARATNPWWPTGSVVPLAIEGDQPAARATRSETDPNLVLSVGRMAPGERYKGHDELLETFPTVIAAQPSARLVLAGDGADRDRLVAKAAELGLSSRVEFPGFVDDDTLGSLYERCALFAMPSRGEGFGLVYLEAMRSAKPCLAARGSAAEEVVIDGETGLLVDPDDREELATALVRLLANPELASRMGERGQERWRREFRPEAFDRRYHPLLERLTT